MRFLAAFVVLLCGAAAVMAQQAGSGWLGAELKDLTKAEADALGWEAPRGAKIVKPQPGGPAQQAGLQAGDILVSLDGMEIENKEGFIPSLSAKAAGTTVRLSIRRQGREKRLRLRLGARPERYAVVRPKPLGPMLRLDTGGHMALIEDIAFTPDGQQIVSASDDKAIRVWDIASAKTVRVIRGEIAPGQAGKIYAMALSPDGKYLAAGGNIGDRRAGIALIRLYDFASGRLVALLKGHEDVVLSLAFSADGRHLISGSADKTAIIWDVEKRKLLHRLKGHRDAIYAVAFTPDGERAVTGSDDQTLRLWRVSDGELIREMTGHEDKVYALVVAPNGTIASGDLSGEIRLWDGRTGKFLRTLARQKTWVGSLTFSPDGKRLLSGVGTAPTHCHVYDTNSGRELITYSGHDNVVIASAISPDGRWAATGGGANNEIHIWDLGTSKRRTSPDGKPLSLSGKGRPAWAVGFGEDGRSIAWGNKNYDPSGLVPINDRGPLEFSLILPGKDRPLGAPARLGDNAQTRFRRAVSRHGAWSLRHRKGGAYGYDAILEILRDGDVVKSIMRDSIDGYDHRAYSFSPDGQTIISGGMGGVLSAYDRAGNKIGDFLGHEGDIWALAISPDGRYLLSGSNDQTVKLWNLKTRELLVTLFAAEIDGRIEWVMWTKSGYFTGSGRGSDMVGWQINRGPDKNADFVTAGQLRRHLYRRDIVEQTIALGSEAAALRALDVRGFKLDDLLKRPVPRFSITAPAGGATVRGGAAILTLKLTATPDPVRRIRIRIGERQIADLTPDSGGVFTPGEWPFSVALAEGRNEINVTASNDIGEATQTLILNHQGPGDLDQRGTLYIIAVGADKYPKAKPLYEDLRFAGADARTFAAEIEKRLGPLYRRVVRRLLVNGPEADAAPERTPIINTLDLLRGAQPNDTVVVFLAGHGTSEEQNYRFLPSDSSVRAGRLMPASIVPWYAIKEALDNASGRRLLFLDTCHSGDAYTIQLDQTAYHDNILVYASAHGAQIALEDPRLGHGLFTAGIVKGLDGAADRNRDKRVMSNELGRFVAAWVKRQAIRFGQRQEPQLYRGKGAEDYLLARVK